MPRALQDVFIYNENSVTLLGTDNKTASSTYLIQLNLQQTSSHDISNDLIEVTTNNNGASNEGTEGAEKASKENTTKNLLMIKAEKLQASSIVKHLQKAKSSSLCVSSSRKVAALVSRIIAGIGTLDVVMTGLAFLKALVQQASSQDLRVGG